MTSNEYFIFSPYAKWNKKINVMKVNCKNDISQLWRIAFIIMTCKMYHLPASRLLQIFTQL